MLLLGDGISGDVVVIVRLRRSIRSCSLGVLVVGGSGFDKARVLQEQQVEVDGEDGVGEILELSPDVEISKFGGHFVCLRR